MFLKTITSSKKVNPYGQILNVDQSTRSFLERYFGLLSKQKASQDKPKINVDEISLKVASFYENIRKVVDWKEEHLMRRIAIERIIKRRLFLRKTVEQAAEPLVLELIRGGHFPNNSIEKAKIDQVQQLIERYNYFLTHTPTIPKGITKSQFYDFIFKIAACDLEELLDPWSYAQARILMSYMEEIMKKKIYINEKTRQLTQLDSQELTLQIYIAVQQALFKLDRPIMAYNLLKRYYAKWFSDEEQDIKYINQHVFDLYNTIQQRFDHKLANKFYNVCSSYNTPFVLLGDIIIQDPNELNQKITQPNHMRELLRQTYEKRLGGLKKRLGRSALYSTISVFFTNIFSLYAIEIPFAKLVLGKFDLISMVADIFVPTLLMAFLVFIIKKPPANNFELIWEETKKILYANDQLGRVEVESYKGKNIILKFIFGFLYLLSFVVCLGGMIWFLNKLHFPLPSYFIFVIFASLILFTGSIIRKRSRELHMRPPRESFWTFISDPFILPIIYLGKWLAGKWQKYNVIGIFFVILVDSPFVVFAEILEQWRYFIREKKEGIH